MQIYLRRKIVFTREDATEHRAKVNASCYFYISYNQIMRNDELNWHSTLYQRVFD